MPARLLVLACLCCAAPAAEGLRAALAPLLERVPAGARAGIVVGDGHGGVAYAHGGDRVLPMASLAKLFVAQAALETLGPDYHFRTRLYALGAIGGDGAVPRIGILGGGDPCLDEHFTAKRPDRAFAPWLAALREAGIRRIGEVVVDGSLFSGPAKPPTYPQDATNQQRWYSAPASAFAWNDNCIEVRVVPTQSGERARVQVRPRSPRIEVDNRTRTAAGKVPSKLIVRRVTDANRLIVAGEYSKTTSWYPLSIHEDADLLAADHFAALCGDAGIAVADGVVAGEFDRDGARLLHEIRNPLWPALDILNTRSQNFYGEQILRLIGVHDDEPGSVEGGARALHAALRAAGMPADGWRVIDGSGLSYGNRASAAAVHRLLVLAAAGEHGDRFRATLKDKWWGEDKAKVKTGSLAISRCLAGYVPGGDDRWYPFAILLHRGDAGTIGWATGLRDLIFRRIVESLR